MAAVHGCLPLPGSGRTRIRFRSSTPIRAALLTIFVDYRRRAVLGFVLMVAEAFFYDAIFFSYGLILTVHYEVPADSIGRKPMITFTYAASGIVLAVTVVLFDHGALDATTQTRAWMVVFFFASAAASSAYLTVSESFPPEVRVFAIALFYVLGTAMGGIAGPWLFGALIESGSVGDIALGYFLGAGLMIAAAMTEPAIGVRADRRPLESAAAPLSSVTGEAAERGQS